MPHTWNSIVVHSEVKDDFNKCKALRDETATDTLRKIVAFYRLHNTPPEVSA